MKVLYNKWNKKSKTKNIIKYCEVCERDIHRSTFANHLKTDGKIKCDIGRITVEKERYETQLPIYLVIAMLRTGLEDQKRK